MNYEECKASYDGEWDALTEYIAKENPCKDGWERYIINAHRPVDMRWYLTPFDNRRWLRTCFRAELGALVPICQYLGIEPFRVWDSDEFLKFWNFVEDLV